jgi:hypothetical protein
MHAQLLLVTAAIPLYPACGHHRGPYDTLLRWAWLSRLPFLGRHALSYGNFSSDH